MVIHSRSSSCHKNHSVGCSDHYQMFHSLTPFPQDFIHLLKFYSYRSWPSAAQSISPASTSLVADQQVVCCKLPSIAFPRGSEKNSSNTSPSPKPSLSKPKASSSRRDLSASLLALFPCSQASATRRVLVQYTVFSSIAHNVATSDTTGSSSAAQLVSELL